ncbi:putative salicylate hydroxylase [Aureobasidium pullulans]|uniref:Putative salicylate hydroxylase n=1 Tax=Aureobasidium pullulans TaxID=5580 RepID=A0A4S9WZ13_AURPU|nr:putative salicylate hydroxylase [Aureobasidium pullulans]
MTVQNTPEFAIVGGGIVGLICALGLIDRGINVRVYEQADGLRENGAGLAFTRNAVECLRLVSPLASEALRSVQTPNGDTTHPNDHLQWVDGFNQHDQNDPMYEPVLFKLFVGANGFEGCHRAHLLEALWKRLPSGSVIFGKKLQTIDDDPHNNKAILHFMDGSTAQADADLVIGCDGIKSRTRALLLGSDHPASKPQYTHKLSYRALIPMEKAIAALGAQKALNQCMHIGPDRHLLHFPVADQKLLNVVAFNTNCDPWTGDNGRLIAPATRQEVVEAFKDWNKPVRTITEMFPEVGEKWAVFDSYEHPVPFYSKGRVCLAGDSAHAAAPHHGAGAGAGVEDVLCLITAIDKALLLATPKTALTNAFSIYDGMRYERTQWLVESSHEVCEMYELDHPLTKGDMGKCKDEIEARSHKIWYFDYEDMLRQTLSAVDKLLGQSAPRVML